VCATRHQTQPDSILQLKRHEHAAQHCECALAVLEDGHVGSNSPSVQPPPGKLLLDSSVRAIAHFNLAVECEFLNQLDSAAHHYNMCAAALCSLCLSCRVDFRLNRSISVARSDCGAESATARTFESQAVEALNDLAKKKRAKASKSSPEKIQPLIPKLDLSLVQVRALHATHSPLAARLYVSRWPPRNFLSLLLNQVSTAATAQLCGGTSGRGLKATANAAVVVSAGDFTSRSARGNGTAAHVKQPLSARGPSSKLKVGNDGITCFDIRTPRNLL
jgi:hypothetical protein